MQRFAGPHKWGYGTNCVATRDYVKDLAVNLSPWPELGYVIY